MKQSRLRRPGAVGTLLEPHESISNPLRHAADALAAFETIVCGAQRGSSYETSGMKCGYRFGGATEKESHERS